MAKAWIDNIKQTRQLNYYLDSSITGTWATVVAEMIGEFNALSTQHTLGVRFVVSQDRPTDGGGANVQIAAAAGEVTFSFGGEHQRVVDGNRLHGYTFQLNYPNSGLEKAFIYLPAQPMVNTPSGLRAVGAGVMKVIAFHELVHACGLENSDHSNDDVFNGIPSVDAGRDPSRDRVQISTTGGSRFMPPIILSVNTATAIRQLWI